MIKPDWTKLRQNAFSTMKDFPIETFISICFFIFVVAKEEELAWPPVAYVDNALAYLPLWWIVSFSLNQLFQKGRKRWIYRLSLLLACTAPVIPFEPDHLSYFIVWIMAVTFLLATKRQMDNRSFTISALRTGFHLVMALILTLALSLLSCSIIASIVYIFDLNTEILNTVVFYIFLFPLSVIAPFLFCFFESTDTDTFQWQPLKALDILGNWILSPALIIYTLLLYVYGLKILITWDLPKGLLSYMISIYLFIAVIARACQFLLGKKPFDWFYQRLNLIAIPILILMWIGILYRIIEYGLTEERVYLLVLAVLISVVSLMTFTTPRQKYLYFLYLVMGLLAPLTFIPGIQARQLGILSQEHRLKQVIQRLNLQEEDSGQIKKDHIPEALRDNASAVPYKRLTEGFRYLLSVTSANYMEEKYGYASIRELEEGLFKGNRPDYLLREDKRNIINYHNRGSQLISVSGYRLLIEKELSAKVKDEQVILETDSLFITAFKLQDFFEERQELLNEDQDANVDSLLYLQNDSCYAVIDRLSIRERHIDYLTIKYVLLK